MRNKKAFEDANSRECTECFKHRMKKKDKNGMKLPTSSFTMNWVKYKGDQFCSWNYSRWKPLSNKGALHDGTRMEEGIRFVFAKMDQRYGSHEANMHSTVLKKDRKQKCLAFEIFILQRNRSLTKCVLFFSVSSTVFSWKFPAGFIYHMPWRNWLKFCFYDPLWALCAPLYPRIECVVFYGFLLKLVEGEISLFLRQRKPVNFSSKHGSL